MDKLLDTLRKEPSKSKESKPLSLEDLETLPIGFTGAVMEIGGPETETAEVSAITGDNNADPIFPKKEPKTKRDEARSSMFNRQLTLLDDFPDMRSMPKKPVKRVSEGTKQLSKGLEKVGDMKHLTEAFAELNINPMSNLENDVEHKKDKLDMKTEDAGEKIPLVLEMPLASEDHESDNDDFEDTHSNLSDASDEQPKSLVGQFIDVCRNGLQWMFPRTAEPIAAVNATDSGMVPNLRSSTPYPSNDVDDAREDAREGALDDAQNDE